MADIHGTRSPDGTTTSVNTHMEEVPIGDDAMRVFVIPELLEKILLLAAADQIDDGGDISLINPLLNMVNLPACGNLSEGGVCLFRIQRVNNTFLRTIQGSVKLRQLMFSSLIENDKLEIHREERLCPLHEPIFVLLNILYILSGKDVLSTDYKQEVREYDDCGQPTNHKDSEVEAVKLYLLANFDRNYTADKRTFFARLTASLEGPMGHVNASWRRIKVCNAAVPKNLKVTIRGVQWWNQAGAENQMIRRPEVMWEIQGDATLGDVFELFFRFFQVLGDCASNSCEPAGVRLEQTIIKQKQMEERHQRERERQQREKEELWDEYHRETEESLLAIGRQQAPAEVPDDEEWDQRTVMRA